MAEKYVITIPDFKYVTYTSQNHVPCHPCFGQPYTSFEEL